MVNNKNQKKKKTIQKCLIVFFQIFTLLLFGE